MLVSVIMPVYNAASFLREAIQSLLNQIYTDWELIAVDDGSTDESLKILQSYSDPRIRIIQRPNGGQCAATNTGLDYIRGEYIQFFDADDLMDSNKILMQVNALKVAENSIAVCKWAFFVHSIEESKFKDEPVYFSGSNVEWLCRLWSYETMMPNHGYLIPRHIMEKAGRYYDESLLLNIDFEYFTRMVLEAESIVYCPESICYYRKSVATSKTYRPAYKKQISALNARVKALDNFLTRHNDTAAKEAARKALTMLTFTFPSIRRHSKKAIKDLGLEKFGMFGGRRFKALATLVGFENAIRIKDIYQKLR